MSGECNVLEVGHSTVMSRNFYSIDWHRLHSERCNKIAEVAVSSQFHMLRNFTAIHHRCYTHTLFDRMEIHDISVICYRASYVNIEMRLCNAFRNPKQLRFVSTSTFLRITSEMRYAFQTRGLRDARCSDCLFRRITHSSGQRSLVVALHKRCQSSRCRRRMSNK